MAYKRRDRADLHRHLQLAEQPSSTTHRLPSSLNRAPCSPTPKRGAASISLSKPPLPEVSPGLTSPSSPLSLSALGFENSHRNRRAGRAPGSSRRCPWRRWEEKGRRPVPIPFCLSLPLIPSLFSLLSSPAQTATARRPKCWSRSPKRNQTFTCT